MTDFQDKKYYKITKPSNGDVFYSWLSEREKELYEEFGYTVEEVVQK